MNYYKKILFNKSIKILLFLNTIAAFISFQTNSAKAFEFQWNPDSGYRQLKWRQRTPEKNFKNSIYFFFRPSDRRTGLLSVNIKIPKNFKTNLKPKNITFCKANFGDYSSRTKCIENITSDIVIDNEKKIIEIYPISPIPSDKDTYAVVLKINNPRRAGLYQFHSFGKSSGPVPVGTYLGSWTLKIDP